MQGARADIGGRGLTALFAGQATSLLGNQATAFVFSVYVLRDVDRVLLWSVILFSGYFCGTVTSFASGPLLSRLGSRTMLLVACCSGAVASATLLLLYGTGVLEPWMLLATNAISGATIGIQEPSFIKLLYSAAEGDAVVRLQGIAQTIAAVAFATAPGLAALMYDTTGMGSVLVLDLISFGALAAAVLRLPALREEAGETEPAKYRVLWRRRSFTNVVVLIAAAQLFLSTRQTLRAPVILDANPNNSATLATVLTVGAIGGILGGLVVSWVGDRLSYRKALAGGLIASGLVGQSLFGLVPNVWAWSSATFVVSALAPLLASIGYAAALQGMPAHLQSHAVAFMRGCVAVTVPVAVLAAGPATDAAAAVSGTRVSEGGALVMVATGLFVAGLGIGAWLTISDRKPHSDGSPSSGAVRFTH